MPSNAPASVINYNSLASYPNGAFGESVFADNSVSASPDAVGGKAAYFVGDLSVNETISQLTYLRVGNYRLGSSYFLTANGRANPGNSSFRATIIGAPVAATAIISGAPGRVRQNVSGVGQITQAGYYTTAFVFNSNLGGASKDIVIDRAFCGPDHRSGNHHHSADADGCSRTVELGPAAARLWLRRFGRAPSQDRRCCLTAASGLAFRHRRWGMAHAGPDSSFQKAPDAVDNSRIASIGILSYFNYAKSG